MESIRWLDKDFSCIGCDVLFRDAIALLKAQEPVEPTVGYVEMTDREKVIKGLEKAVEVHDGIIFSPMYDMWMDATKEALALLKAQEAVEPIENAGFYYCGACRYAFTSARQKYCSECGRAVKWE